MNERLVIVKKSRKMVSVLVQLSFFVVAASLAVASPIFPVPGMMNKEYFQGDMKLTEHQKMRLKSGYEKPGQFGTGLILETTRWPKDILGFVRVPYTVRATDAFSE